MVKRKTTKKSPAKKAVSESIEALTPALDAVAATAAAGTTLTVVQQQPTGLTSGCDIRLDISSLVAVPMMVYKRRCRNEADACRMLYEEADAKLQELSAQLHAWVNDSMQAYAGKRGREIVDKLNDLGMATTLEVNNVSHQVDVEQQLTVITARLFISDKPRASYSAVVKIELPIEQKAAVPPGHVAYCKQKAVCQELERLKAAWGKKLNDANIVEEELRAKATAHSISQMAGGNAMLEKMTQGFSDEYLSDLRSVTKSNE